jgi:hypothetical protein
MNAMLGSLLLAASTLGQNPTDAAAGGGPFADRGYYITFMRMPTFDLDDWKPIVDGIREDGGNLLILWVAGAFRSGRWPITWRYNVEHQNVRRDFVRALIDHAHTRGVRVILGFTPFGYDGVNQYAIERPELRAVGKDGKPVGEFGIGCWGFNLCPSRPESRRFQLDYVREMFFEFYPNADGLMIESSDYAICHCPDCGERFLEREFAFVKQLSDEVWARRSGAMVVVYPHYFSGESVPGLGVRAARHSFDPRWTLFFTPHSAHLDPSLVKLARHSLWWDDAPALRGPREVQAGARRARDAGVTGYVPSLEGYSYLATHVEEGQDWIKGRRQVPWGFGWLKDGESPYNELPLRVQRIAYRAFSRDPDLGFEDFKAVLGREVFGPGFRTQAVEDLLALQSVFAAERTWSQPAPLACPERVRAMNASGHLTEAKRVEYRAALDRLRQIAGRYAHPSSPAERALGTISRWVLALWEGENATLLQAELPR